MNQNEAKFSFRNREGQLAEAVLSVEDYKAAADKSLSLAQHLEQTYGMKTDSQKYGTVLQQMMASSGMYLNADRHTGLRPPSMKDILAGTVQINMSAITKPEGNNGAGARLLFPEVIMQTIESELRTDDGDFLGTYNSMVGQTQSINGQKFEQPVIDITAPKSSEAQPISQMAEPDVMIGITTSDVSRKIPTKSIGLMISDEAQQASTLDLVNLIVGVQAREERVRMVENDIKAMVNGDVDRNETGLTATKFVTFDSTISSAGAASHKAYIKWLRANYRKMTLDYIVTDEDTALALEGRSGKPTRDSVDDSGSQFSTAFSLENLGIRPPKILLVDTALLGVNTLVGLDSRSAIRRVINASYFVVLKACALTMVKCLTRCSLTAMAGHWQH